MVFKRGRKVNIDERPALELAAQYGLPVPRVYDAGDSNGETFIEMDFIEGDRLDLVWPTMIEDEKGSICAQRDTNIDRQSTLPTDPP